MKGKWILSTVLTGALVITGCSNNDTKNEDNEANKENKKSQSAKSSNDVKYPKDGVRGIYVSADATNGEKFKELTKFIDESDLNAMVIDVKDDSGNVTINFNTGNKEIDKHTLDIVDAKPLLNKMKEKDIYPIARIVTFKDKNLAESHPEWSFKQTDGSVWESDGGDKFVNPFVKDVWKYNINVSKEAAKAGFRDIQYDYVRFPEAFENVESNLTYDKGDYKNSELSDVDQRVDTITQFLKTARKELKPYGAEISADVFGYAAMVEEAPGIGQSFPKIAENTDAISSMIYPSHWSSGDFGLEAPDKEPYEAVDHYLDKETSVLNKLGDKKPKSRPWLQDFTARYLGEGKYIEYDSKAVEAQIQALKDHGIKEYLLWNAANDYTQGVDYTPEANKEKLEQNKEELKKEDKDEESNKDNKNEK
ncbi:MULTISPECIES: putative glycoside hydrolase [Staphylococcus]|uniref:putative glycoside hydrolase n=1 Tax=Staphylococcus TaxID=1279 RepID=UPI000853CED3|nr:putative glycoside hydrolase [Staphylococcus shinii]MEC5301449.1 putative glycoside hydrolase [Staphylococcus shinii]OEK83804.1 GTP-binding protein [Staphylococcus shinii]PTI03573.1 GTP-binding protein [Staphylococcus shinii]PTI67558.1 GTP-binding protein [Staphylococcus shinii]QRA16818.1 putative glycoside hydrolase [Staphylococcus shinii]